MQPLIHHNRMQTAAVIALVACTMMAVWSASSSARTDPPYPGATPYPGGTASGHTASSQPATQPAELPPPVVTLKAPQAANDKSETLPIVISSVALLVALGAAGFTLLAGGRMRRAPQPSA
jgi:hypothetical protein